MIEFRMPSLGADMEAGTLVEWLVKPGDVVKRGDIIAMVDTQKGLFDIEIFDAGRIDQLILNVGEKAPVGTVMATLNREKETPKVMIETEKEKGTQMVAPTQTLLTFKASPLAKRIAKELGIDLSSIKGTGEEGAIIKVDVENAARQIKAIKPPVQKTVATQETIRMAVAAAMTKSNKEIPHYYLETKVDMNRALTWLVEANKQRSVKQRLLPVVLFIKAVAKALTDVPQLNAYWEDGLQLKEQINIGFVISLRTGGILIPAIHDVDNKTLDEIMEWINETIPRVRAMNLRSSDITATTITLTSLAGGSAETVFGIIYPPQVAIVGIGSVTEQPWAENGMLDVRPVVKVTLSADHRATDGQMGSRFLIAMKNYLQKPEEL